MPSDQIQWFPGHMAKTRRLIAENLKQVDIVLELRDARIPYSSQNPEIHRIVGGKPMLTLLTKSTLADPKSSKRWIAAQEANGTPCLLVDAVSGEGLSSLMPKVKDILSEKLLHRKEKGLENRAIKAMIVGIPNVGKSSLVNRLAGAKRAKVENRPGVTLTKQWVVSDAYGLHLMDMPGVLWPKFEEKTVGENLAITGAIKDEILDTETIAALLCNRLRRSYPEMLAARYKLNELPDAESCSDYDLLLMIGKARGFCLRGGEIDSERTANMLLDEFRSAKIGRITLELPRRQA